MLAWGLSEMGHTKHLTQGLASTKFSIKVSYYYHYDVQVVGTQLGLLCGDSGWMGSGLKITSLA